MPKTSPSLLAEIASYNVKKGPSCSTGLLLESLDSQTASELRAALDDPTLLASSIVAALKARGFVLSAPSLRRHRKHDCACR